MRRLALDLQRKGYEARTVGVKLRFDDFRIVTRDQTLAQHTQEPETLRWAAGQCLKRVDLSRRLRLLGVRAAGLRRAGAGTGTEDGSSPPRGPEAEGLSATATGRASRDGGT